VNASSSDFQFHPMLDEHAFDTHHIPHRGEVRIRQVRGRIDDPAHHHLEAAVAGYRNTCRSPEGGSPSVPLTVALSQSHGLYPHARVRTSLPKEVRG
jgi:hypothetical protein